MKKIYHVFRGSNVNIESGYTFDFIPDISGLSDDAKQYIINNFPEGISNFGYGYLLALEFPDGIISSLYDDLGSYAIESHLELMRVHLYPNAPSRFQSIFGFETIEDIWINFISDDGKQIKSGCKVYEISVNSYHKYDESFLYSPLHTHKNMLQYNFPRSFNILDRYLKQEISDYPRFECVAKLPATVVREVKIAIVDGVVKEIKSNNITLPNYTFHRS